VKFKNCLSAPASNLHLHLLATKKCELNPGALAIQEFHEKLLKVREPSIMDFSKNKRISLQNIHALEFWGGKMIKNGHLWFPVSFSGNWR